MIEYSRQSMLTLLTYLVFFSHLLTGLAAAQSRPGEVEKWQALTSS